jgi:signal transduction histidine kinase
VTAPAALWLDADRARIQQVVVNLLSNACKFGPRESRIAVRATADGGDALLVVEDQGDGIPAELLPHIFDVFTQAAPHGARAGDGLGLGLGVVRSIVAMHGGTVAAFSDGPGRGARLVVRLKLAGDVAS